VAWTTKIPRLAGVCLLVLALDQATKFWAVENLTRAFEVESAKTLPEKLRSYRVMKNLEPLRRAPIVVVEGFWRFRYLENPGAAWGILGGLDPRYRLPFFRLAPILAVALLGWFYFRAARQQRLLRLSLASIVGGALGNFVDRWIHGYVIDFVDWEIAGFRWPTFNVADVFITLGIVGVAIETGLASRRRRRRRKAEAALGTAPPVQTVDARATGEALTWGVPPDESVENGASAEAGIESEAVAEGESPRPEVEVLPGDPEIDRARSD